MCFSVQAIQLPPCNGLRTCLLELAVKVSSGPVKALVILSSDAWYIIASTAG